MHYERMPIEKESPEEIGYANIQYNLAESSVSDLLFSELNISLNDLRLEYVGHRGNEAFRALLVKETENLSSKDVLLTIAAAGALFIIHTSLLTKDDHLIVLRPNYATNIKVPETIGCKISYIDLQFTEDWQIDIRRIAEAITPATRLISITTPHNPTGMVIDEITLNQIIKLTETHGIHLLVDETYRDTSFVTPHAVAASKSKNVITVSSLSKAYGLPGLRMGWIICQDEILMEQFLAAKEMIYISNSAIDEEVAYRFYLQKEKFERAIRQRTMQNFELLKQWLRKEERLECVLPKGGVVCFPRFAHHLAVDSTKFYQILLHLYNTMVGPGHWFDMPDSYMRIGFGWTNETLFERGLKNISSAIDECLQ
jgi:aspartate/methionine/tyrosine aminotransferase